jgi:hypothetical protein
MNLLDPRSAPATRVTKSRVADYIAELAKSCAPITLVCRTGELYDALRVLDPDNNWRWLADLYNSLARRAVPVRDKRMRLRSSHDIVELGMRLMGEAEEILDLSPCRRAVRYRDGLMIVLLIHRPIRLNNFASIRIGRHLVQHEHSWSLIFSEHEVKNAKTFAADLPQLIVPALARYLSHHRCVLLGDRIADQSTAVDALWVSAVGKPLSEFQVYIRISKHTKAGFGASMPPHWFRDAAATTIAIENPTHVGDAHHVLGNTFAMTEKHYNQARSLEASRRHHAMIAALRASAKGGH